MIKTMMPTGDKSVSVNRQASARRWIGLSLAVVLTATAPAETVILHLKNGDRIAGEIVSEDTNQVVVTTSWTKGLRIPLNEIERRESAPKSIAGAPPPVPTNRPAPIVLVKAKPVETPKPKHWKIEASAGADFLSGPQNQEIYHGRINYSYAHPYLATPAKSVRNVMDFSVDYGITRLTTPVNGNSSVLSANRMYGSDKTDVDVGKGKWFLYGMGGAGYNELRRIDLQYEIGGGMGFHALNRASFLLNFEGGLDHQEEYRADNTITRNLFIRLSQDSTWKINQDITFTERIEYLPRDDSSDFRARAESTLTYILWRNVSLHLGLLDFYDTKPAQNVAKNDLQVHTSVGVTF